MNDRECLRTSTNVWRSLYDHCELMANCIRKPIRHTFATGETSITFETPQKRPRMLTNSYECLAIICDHYEFMANCIRKPIRHIRPSVRLALQNALLAIFLRNINRTNKKGICLIRLEILQCNIGLRSLENVNDKREIPQEDNRLGEMFIFAASFVKNPDT